MKIKEIQSNILTRSNKTPKLISGELEKGPDPHRVGMKGLSSYTWVMAISSDQNGLTRTQQLYLRALEKGQAMLWIVPN